MLFDSALKPKLIYVIRINDANHSGCLKVGEATLVDSDDLCIKPNSSALNKSARKRIYGYTRTAGIDFDLLYTEIAAYKCGDRFKAFGDRTVHNVLFRSGIKQHKGANFGKEWFETDLNTIINAIKAVKEGRKSLLASEITEGQSPIVFRPEQRDAIDKTKKQFKKGDRMLWNAKMRFGKTVSALQVIKELDFHRTLILTHRPVVDDGWYNDFKKIFYDRKCFRYGSKNLGESFSALEAGANAEGVHYIYFASMQDLRGSETVGGKFNKNDEIFSTQWDFIIVDEAHEGTQTELGQSVIEELKKPFTKVLSLSGTPYNICYDYSVGELYTWDYVMEQKAKAQWDLAHFGDPNPYAGLPVMNIYTYDLGRLLHDYIDEDVAFNFREFFRVSDSGEFIHKPDVAAFLNLLCKKDEQSAYPFANDSYRDIFRHTLWMIPGVKSALALQRMLERHPVFRHFTVVNVAGDGDPTEQENDEALALLRSKIGNDPDLSRTITLSCGRLTTGVSVPEWTAVLMLSGSFNTAAAGYMQTIFRVQTPATINGRVKEQCYVFDFAPDRTLKVLADTANVSTKAGDFDDSNRKAMGEFLNFCPVIGIEGSKMRKFDVDTMMQQLKKVYIERVVNNGFEDGYLYNNELTKLDSLALEEFNDLKKTIGQTKAMPKTNSVDVNNQGLTDEEYEELEDLEKKSRKKKDRLEMTEEQQKRREELKAKKKNRETAISILRGISIRMPLMIYGADIDDDKDDITIDNFTSLIDSLSWDEFMPRGVTKQKFNAFRKYYDRDVFAAAAKRIRNMLRSADNLSIEQRIERITQIFHTFRNPDKETVLTPWRVVNMHLSDTLGGYCFFGDDFDDKKPLADPRFVDRGKVTTEVFNPDTRILEINSKSGLYPLYMAYSTYRAHIASLITSPDSIEDEWAVWRKVIEENIFVICKTPMAKSITRRTLVGFRPIKVNTRYFEDLINQIKNKPTNFIEKVKRGKSFWKAINNDNMNFNAIVGNPPYQVMNDGAGASASPVYNFFVEISKKIAPTHMSMIMPARWFAGGRGVDEFRKAMLSDKRLSLIHDFFDARACFSNVEIKGGIMYFRWDKDYCGNCHIVSHAQDGIVSVAYRPLIMPGIDTFIRYNEAVSIVEKVRLRTIKTFDSIVSSRDPFGLDIRAEGTFIQVKPKFTFSKNKATDVAYYYFGWRKDGVGYLDINMINEGRSFIESPKLFIPCAWGNGRIEEDRLRPFIPEHRSVCFETYLMVGPFNAWIEVENAEKYINTKFFHMLVSPIKISQHATKSVYRFVPLQDFTENSDIDWSRSVAEIDRQLYAKYALTEDEIAFIESMIKPM